MWKIVAVLIIIFSAGIIIGQAKFSTIMVNSDTIIKDSKTGLIWTRCNLDQNKAVPEGECLTTEAPVYPALYTWGNAKKACDDLVYGDRTDWRLPTAKELLSIMYYKSDKQAPTGVPELLINIDFFPNNYINVFAEPRMSNWSSTNTYDKKVAYIVLYDWGAVQTQYKTKTYAVRCVAGPVK